MGKQRRIQSTVRTIGWGKVLDHRNQSYDGSGEWDGGETTPAIAALVESHCLTSRSPSD